VFILVNPPALAILQTVHLAPLLGSQTSTIRLAFGPHFVVNRTLLLFEVGRLARRERTALHA